MSGFGVGVGGCFGVGPYHARAGKRVPAESDAIAILDIAPLVLESLVVHGCE